MACILWIDNDRTFLMPFVSRLEHAGHTVIRAHTISGGEFHLNHQEETLGADGMWDLVLIDIMMAMQDKALGDRYSAEATHNGRRTGVVFYEINRERIASLGAVVAFLTMREDEDLKGELSVLGIPAENVRHKMDVSDTRDFQEWIEGLIQEKRLR